MYKYFVFFSVLAPFCAQTADHKTKRHCPTKAEQEGRSKRVSTKLNVDRLPREVNELVASFCDNSPSKQTLLSRTVRPHGLPYTHDIESVDFNPDGIHIAVGAHYSGKTSIWNVRNNTKVANIPRLTPDTEDIVVRWHPDGITLALGSQLGFGDGLDDETEARIILWNKETNNIHVLSDHMGIGVESIDFNNDGSLVAASTYDMLHVFSVAGHTATLNVQLDNSSEPPEPENFFTPSVCFNPQDTALLAYSTSKNNLHIIDTARGDIVCTLHGADMINSLSWHGTTLATGSNDKMVTLWDTRARQEIATMQGHARRVTSVRMNPAGTLLASGSPGENIRLWDVRKTEPLAVLTKHNTTTSLSWSPNGRTLASGSLASNEKDMTLGIWDLATLLAQNDVLNRLTLQEHSVVRTVASSLEENPKRKIALRTWEHDVLNNNPALKSIVADYIENPAGK